MTKRALDDHMELLHHLESERKMLTALESAATPGDDDRAGYLAVEIADMRETIAQHEAAMACSGAMIAAYIQTIENSQTRMIFRLRFIRGLTWGEIADTIGGRNTEEGVKATCLRYIARGGPARMGRPPKQKSAIGGRCNSENGAG